MKIDLARMPEKRKRNVFIDLRKFLSDISVRATKRAFQSANFISGETGWKLNSSGLIEGTRLQLDNFVPYDDSSVVFVGTWASLTANNFYGNDANVSSTVGDTFTITFVGTSIGLVIEKASNMGKLDVSIDGGTTTTVDLYSTTSFTRSIVYSATGLNSGEHTLVATVATKNASSSANNIRFQGYVKSPTEGIKIDAISADLITIATELTTDSNGYATLGAPAVPSGYSAWCITGAQLTEAVMSDSTLTDPMISTLLNKIYLYNGAATTSYAVLVEFLVSKV